MPGVTEALARSMKFELNTGTTALPTWVEVSNVNAFSASPSSVDANTTTFDDEGWQSHLKSSRNFTYTIGGLYQEDPDTGARDPGQDAVEAWAEEIGPASRKEFRITSPSGQTTREFVATAESSPAGIGSGGGNDDPNAWTVTVKQSGAATVVTA